jgi:hypothetical protein
MIGIEKKGIATTRVFALFFVFFLDNCLFFLLLRIRLGLLLFLFVHTTLLL